MIQRFPFTAIVGQPALKRSLVLNALRPDIGGVLIRGERGTAKSTAARALADLLPSLQAVDGCPFACDPAAPSESRCDLCQDREAAGETLSGHERHTSFVDLPVGATEDRVVGTLDIQKVLATGERRFEPGILAAANRGILYVDEVNLLDDHVVDALLDAAAMGVNVVEREGVSFSHPARFILIGTMNPEEGDLRPQLTDRFGLSVQIEAVRDTALRTEILRRRLAFDADPAGFESEWHADERALADRILEARKRLPGVAINERDLRVAAEMVSAAGVDGHRAELAIIKTAQANAAFEARDAIALEDLALAARMALAHRMRRGLFEGEAADLSMIDAVLENQRQREAEQSEEEAGGAHKGDDGEGGDPGDGGQDDPTGPTEEQESGSTPSEDGTGMPRPGEAKPGEETEGRPVASAEAFDVQSMDSTRLADQISRKSAGRRSVTRSETRRGRYVRAEPADGRYDDIAFDASLRQAAVRQSPLVPGTAVKMELDDLQRKVRERKAGHLILFMVDASWSMATAQRLKAAKGAVMSLLVDAYQRRDRVALAVFRQRGTRVVLPFTASVTLARRRMKDITVGGKTPLAHALHTADQMFKRELARDRAALPMLVMLTDGAGNVSLTGRAPASEARELAHSIRRQGVQSLVIDLFARGFKAAKSPAEALARDLGGELIPLDTFKADRVIEQVRARLAEG